MRKWLAFGFLAAQFAASLCAQQTGQLILTTEPNAEVFWQGISIGKSDDNGEMRISGIPAGSYAILVVKDGFLARSTQLRVNGGEQRQPLPLVALASEPAPEATAPAPAEGTESTGATTPTASETGTVAAGTSESPSPAPATSNPETASSPEPNPPAGVPSTEQATADQPAVQTEDESQPKTPLEIALEKRREATRDPNRRPTSDFQRPAVIPAPLDTESDLAILVWWGLALIAVGGAIHLYRKRRRSERAEEDRSVADFVRTLKATHEEEK